MKPLSTKQKTALGMLARRGFLIAQQHDLTDGVSFNDWRKAEAVAACGRSISEAFNKDFEPLEDHFRKLAGLHIKKRESSGEATTRRRMLWRLDQSLAVIGKVRSWALEIARDAARDRSATLETLPLAELRKLCMTVEGRARKAGQGDGETSRQGD